MMVLIPWRVHHEDSNHGLCVCELFSEVAPADNPDLLDDLEYLAQAYKW